AVGHRDVLVDQRAPVVTTLSELLLHIAVAKFGKSRFVDLHVGAAGSRQSLELFAERRNDVVPELLDIGVGVQDSGVAAAKMQCAGPGNGNLRDEPGMRLDELEVRHIDRLRPADAAVDNRHRLRCALPGRSAASVFSAYGIDADIAKLAIEEAVIGAAAEFAVGRKFQANALLQCQRVLDGRVLGLGEPRPVTLAGSEFGALLEQPLRAQEAADVLGAKWRLWL